MLQFTRAFFPVFKKMPFKLFPLLSSGAKSPYSSKTGPHFNHKKAFKTSTALAQSSIFGGEIFFSGQEAFQFFEVVAQRCGVSYLQIIPTNSLKQYQNKAHGCIWGLANRLLIALSVTAESSKKSIMVVFIVDTGSPVTILSEEVADIFRFNETSTVEVTIMGCKMFVNHTYKEEKYRHINIIGNDFFETMQAQVHIDFRQRIFSIIKVPYFL